MSSHFLQSPTSKKKVSENTKMDHIDFFRMSGHLPSPHMGNCSNISNWWALSQSSSLKQHMHFFIILSLGCVFFFLAFINSWNWSTSREFLCLSCPLSHLQCQEQSQTQSKNVLCWYLFNKQNNEWITKLMNEQRIPILTCFFSSYKIGISFHSSLRHFLIFCGLYPWRSPTKWQVDIWKKWGEVREEGFR